MTPQQQNDDGSWSDAQPIGWQGGIDFEVSGRGPFVWTAWDEDVCVGSGRARTRLGLWCALWLARRRLS